MGELVYFFLPSIYFLRLQEVPWHTRISHMLLLSVIRCCSIQSKVLKIYEHGQVAQVETILLRLLLIYLYIYTSKYMHMQSTL